MGILVLRPCLIGGHQVAKRRSKQQREAEE